MKVNRITKASQILQDTCNHQAMKMTKACTGPHALTAVTIKYQRTSMCTKYSEKKFNEMSLCLMDS